MRASLALSRCVIARAIRGPEKSIDLEVYGMQRADIARVLPVALSYVASEPCPKIRKCLTPLVYVASRSKHYLARCVAPRDLGNKQCSYSFLTQGKIVCSYVSSRRRRRKTWTKWGKHFWVQLGGRERAHLHSRATGAQFLP